MSATQLTSRQSSRGFTIVELMTVLVILPTIVLVFIAVVYDSIDSSTRSKTQLALDADVQTAMAIVERDVRFSKGFRISVGSPFSDPYGANNSGTAGAEAWSHTGVPADANKRALLLSAPSTTQSPLKNNRTPVYTDSPDYTCGADITYNPELAHMVIYFVRSESLYRRILTDTSTALCAGQTQNQKQSCPPELSASWNSLCKAKDEKIASHVSAFTVNYYEERQSSPITDAYTSTDPATIAIADDLEVTITSSRTIGGKTLAGSVTLRIAKVNEEVTL